MTYAIDAGIASACVFVLFIRGTGAMINCENILAQSVIACSGQVAIHCMSIASQAIDRNRQHRHEDQPGYEFYMDELTHKE